MKRIVLLAILALLLAAPAAADVYRYVDKSGTVHFTDRPKHPGYELFLREKRSYRTLPAGAVNYPYREVVNRACMMHGMDEALVRAVIEVESDFNQYAISTAGARGLMQLMPETMFNLGVRNPYDPDQNVQGGTMYLKNLLSRFSGNMKLALAAYNAGPGAVERYGNIPPYPQTRDYVQKVIHRYQKYSGLVR
ncbi:MAG: lytic transglycosylase domain-containing protein [Proteobacteria bacterium]|nr:lytic transglycosylase domain-containing protein [Pseudomonadota bacterium]